MTRGRAGVTVRTVDTEQTVDVQLLSEARKQTAALESLRGIAFAWSVLAVIGLLTWIFLALAS